jgi:hypothetical protein
MKFADQFRDSAILIRRGAVILRTENDKKLRPTFHVDDNELKKNQKPRFPAMMQLSLCVTKPRSEQAQPHKPPYYIFHYHNAQLFTNVIGAYQLARENVMMT